MSSSSYNPNPQSKDQDEDEHHAQHGPSLPPGPSARAPRADVGSAPLTFDPQPTPQINAGGIFAIPSGPSPENIPGFPFPDPSEGLPGPPLMQPQAQHPAVRQGSIQPLPSLMANAPHQEQLPTRPISQPLQGHTPQAQAPSPSTATQPFQPQQTGALNNARPGGHPTDQLSTGYLDPYEAWFPEPRTIADTGLPQGLISDLVLKTMYFTSYMSGQDISATLRLPFYGVIHPIVTLLKREQLCDVSGTAGLGEAGYQYVLTAKGMERAHQILERSSYVGPAPVPLGKYIEVIKMETAGKPAVTRDIVERSLQGMVVSEELTNQVGAAINAGKSLFLFGAPGNGKTLLAEKISQVLGGNIAIPYALEADGQIIQLFDLNSHRPVVPKGMNETDSTKAELHDRRWVRVYRPVVVVGGELTMASLDLVFNENSGFYEAPFQLKANGGLFLIDDFGRQQVSPQALLNRWIVPLEKSIDFLTLKTGKKLQVPFELFLVLSTNLQPEDLIDDAFLRRIQNKLFVPDPTAQQFYEIFVSQCKSMNVPFDQQGFSHLIKKHYGDAGRPFRASHPRDLLRQLIGFARYLNVPPEINPQLIDAACATYFVNSKKK